MAAEKISAVIVTYNSGAEYAGNFAAIKDQVGKIIIVDNGSGAETVAILKSLEKENFNLEVIYFEMNHGLAKAQNTGIKRAMELEYRWVLLLDDDSVPEENMVQKMLEAYAVNPLAAKTAIVAPHIKYKNGFREHYGIFKSGKSFSRARIGDSKYYNNLLFTISSGSLIKTSLFDEIGLMEKDFFIDFIDIELGLRANKNGYNIMVAGQAYLGHEIGRQSQRSIFGVKFTTNNYSAARRKISARNRAILVRKYFREFPFFVLYTYIISLYEIWLIAVFENDKLEKIAKIISGTIEGSFKKLK